jgi:hypothetical protein
MLAHGTAGLRWAAARADQVYVRRVPEASRRIAVSDDVVNSEEDKGHGY